MLDEFKTRQSQATPRYQDLKATQQATLFNIITSGQLLIELQSTPAILVTEQELALIEAALDAMKQEKMRTVALGIDARYREAIATTRQKILDFSWFDEPAKPRNR